MSRPTGRITNSRPWGAENPTGFAAGVAAGPRLDAGAVKLFYPGKSPVPRARTVTPTLLFSPSLFSQPSLFNPALIPLADARFPVFIGQAGWVAGATPVVVAAVDPAEEEESGDEEDLVIAQPADEESNFDDFDDEFDDDFEEDANDPDWDHPDDGDSEPPPGKGGKKK